MKKRTGRQKLAIVTLTAMLCNFQLSSMLWTWAAESNTSSLKSQISSPSNSSVIGDVLDNKDGTQPLHSQRKLQKMQTLNIQKMDRQFFIWIRGRFVENLT